MGKHLIQNNMEKHRYWSNSDGWVDIGQATEFTSLDRKNLMLPDSGQWVDYLLDTDYHVLVVTGEYPTKYLERSTDAETACNQLAERKDIQPNYVESLGHIDYYSEENP